MLYSTHTLTQLPKWEREAQTRQRFVLYIKTVCKAGDENVSLYLSWWWQNLIILLKGQVTLTTFLFFACNSIPCCTYKMLKTDMFNNSIDHPQSIKSWLFSHDFLVYFDSFNIHGKAQRQVF